MTDRLKIFKLLLPAEFVLFDRNPEKMKVTRKQSGGGRSRGGGGDDGASPIGGVAGTLGALFHGVDPLEIRITKARLMGPECKTMCDNLLSWLSPASGIGGAITGAALAAAGIKKALPPDLVIQWGPPGVGTCITARMTKVDINYVRVSDGGIPVHATVNATLQETSSPLSLTNPTSGGRPGRNRHVVHADETLHSIALQAFGAPGAWRAIAEVNGIDDPRSVRPGDVVYLPARDELRELAEAAR